MTTTLRRALRRQVRYAARAATLIAVVAIALPATAQQRAGQDSSAHVDPMGPRPDSSIRSMEGMSMPDTASPRGHSMIAAPLGLPMTRAGSGTSWRPDSSPMYADHFAAGRWDLMVHYEAVPYYDRQNNADPGQRGADQFGIINWAMLMASTGLAGGRIQLRGMLSAEPWTVTAKGYPLLLQSGEAYNGQSLHDRQHPHDLFMELAALYEHRVSRALALQLYIAPVGEPAIGPVAYPHRPSAEDNPFAPIGHHWQDATHISFGVITAGLYSRRWKLEGSVFNGREPDENRTNFDYAGRSLDSYAGRVSLNPNGEWTVSASYAYLKTPEALEPTVSQQRISAVVLNSRPFGKDGSWSSALIYGANKISNTSGLENSVLLETNIDLNAWIALFGRLEYVNKSSRDLAVEMAFPGAHFNVGEATLGYSRRLTTFPGGTLGVGALITLNIVPETLSAYYGSRTPVGFAVFLRIRAGRMAMASNMGAHDHMPMDASGHDPTTGSMARLPREREDSASKSSTSPRWP